MSWCGKVRESKPELGQNGQAMVEFAFVTVFLFALFLGLLQVILLMHAYNTLADAAKEGVRYAIVNGTGNTSQCQGYVPKNANPGTTCNPGGTAKVQQRVVDFAALSFQNITTAAVTVDYDPNSANTNNPVFQSQCSAPGCLVKVTVSYQYHPLFGFSWPKITLYAAADGRIMN